jgi:hypothetical protein
MSVAGAACDVPMKRMSGRALAVTVGVPFDIEFAAPGAGYEWHLLAPPAGIELISRIFRRSSTRADLDAVLQLFHLRATAAAQYDVTFTLRRRSEGTPARTEIIVIEATMPAA